MRLLLIAAAATVLSAAACTKLSSSDLKTAGMSAQIQAVADGTGQTQVTAQLNVDTNGTDFVDLSNGDSLVAATGSHSQTMSRQALLDEITYVSSFAAADAEGTVYTVALQRTTDLSAPNSTCAIPKPFELTAPAANTLSQSKDVTIAYAPSGTGDQMAWTANGSCVAGQRTTGSVSGDPGMLTIPQQMFTTGSAACQVTVTVTRTRPGQLDPHYAGGAISGQQTRTLTITLMP